jgi:1-phosphofructokinase family hexose kinase
MIITVTLNPSLDRTLEVAHITFNEMMRATSSQLDWGGKGFNVSRALQALGAESLALGLVGGATGQMLVKGLSELGIATDLTPIAGETRTNTVVTQAGGDRYIKVNEAGPTVQAGELDQFLDRVQARVRPGDLVLLSGSLPPGVPPGIYAQLIALVQARGARALLDSSGEALRLGCAARPYLAKPNMPEAEELAGHTIRSEDETLRAVRHLLQQGMAWVALSMGAGGLLLASERGALRARPPRVQAQNPVGAGDALLAGIAWALEQELSPAEIARWAVAAGTAAAMGRGVGVGTRAEVERLYEEVAIDPEGLKRT